MNESQPVGILALQGDFAAHGRIIERLGRTWLPVRWPEELKRVCGLIIPGGESTTLLKLMDAVDFEPALREFYERGGAIFGTCAGVIVLATEVTNPTQRSLGLLDVAVERNSYGRQIDSFETYGEWEPASGRSGSLEMVFIRAPRIIRCGPQVQVLARCNDDPVLVAAPRVLGATFHPELTKETQVHELFLKMCGSG